jgi:hypothetical protein
MKREVDESAHANDATGPSFVDSSPRGLDLLEGQSQEQIADSVSQLIRTNRTESKLIGLDGAWGAGKTNLAKIIESRLTDTHHVFFYDAWGHQEDLQRRAFLEELTAELCANELIDSEEWGMKLKDLLSRKRETLTKTIPRLSHGIIVTLLIAILTPIASTIADTIDAPVLKILITSFPLLIGLLLWIGYSIKARHRLTMEEMYHLYKEKDLTKESFITISEKEPSVREFQNWMSDLSRALTHKELIIVFDNMDRLPPRKVRELWSSIHTFFAEGFFDKIWVIITFDRTHIATAFEDNEDVSDQFLSKSFSVIYRVAPPVLTDWQKFFELKFREAFGEDEEHEFHIARRTFDILQQHITPRSIIAFINEMVSLRLTVGGDVRLRYIAVFVLTKKEILNNPVDQILSLEFLQKAAPLFEEDEDLPNHIAAMVYHVPLASASQVSLTREIQNALRDKNGARLNELAKHRYFVDILEQVVAGEELDVESSAATLAMLDDKYKSDSESQERLAEIWDNLCGKALRSPVGEQKFTATHELLLRFSSPPKRKALAAHIVEFVRNAEEFDGAAYYRALSQFDDYVAKNDLGVELLALVKDIRKSPKVFVDYVGIAGSDYRKFKLKCDQAELHEFVAARIPNDLEGLDILSGTREEYDFGPLVDLLKEQVAGNKLTAENVGPFYRFYKAIASEKPIALIDDQNINSLLSQVEGGSEAQLELFAMRLARTSKFPGFRGITQTVLTQADEKTAHRIAERIEFYTSYGELLTSYVTWNQPLLKAVLRDLTLNYYGPSRMNVTEVLKHFSTLSTSLDIAPDDFIKRLDGWSQFAEEQITVENLTEIITDHEFYEYAIELKKKLSLHITKVAVDYLMSLNVEDWRDPLRNEDSYQFNVTYWLLIGGQLKTLPENAVTVYKDVLLEVAKEEFSMDDKAKWDVFYSKTHKSKLKATAKNIRDLFISEVGITADTFLTLAEILRDHADLRERSADAARKILSPVADNDDCLAFILDNSEYFAEIVDNAGDDASDFRDIIRRKAITPEYGKQLIGFARAIGIKHIDYSITEEPEEGRE